MSEYEEMVNSLKITTKDPVLDRNEEINTWLTEVTEALKRHMLEPGAQEKFEKELSEKITELVLYGQTSFMDNEIYGREAPPSGHKED